MKLYELTQDLAALEAKIEAGGGELTPELEKALDTIQGSIQEKVEHIVKWIQNLEAERSGLAEERDRLAKKAIRMADRIQWLRGYLHNCLKANHLMTIRTVIRTVSVVSSPDAVVIENEAAVPVGYWGERKTPFIDLDRIRAEWLENRPVPGTRLEKDRTHLTIR